MDGRGSSLGSSLSSSSHTSRYAPRGSDSSMLSQFNEESSSREMGFILLKGGIGGAANPLSLPF